MGVFYHLAFGVSKNLDKAIDLLTKSAKLGNGQSSYQLSQLYSHEEAPYKDVKKAYYFFEKALLTGVSFFEQFQELFEQNFDELSPIFLATKRPSVLIEKDNK